MAAAGLPHVIEFAYNHTTLQVLNVDRSVTYLQSMVPAPVDRSRVDALRAIPNLTVFRPADGIETALAWAWIAQHTDGPGLLALSRQKVQALSRPGSFQLEDVWKGGYAVREPGGDARVVLVATGSEVSLACAAAEKLEGEGVPARVVSLPCLSLFLAQPESYREALVPSDGAPVVARLMMFESPAPGKPDGSVRAGRQVRMPGPGTLRDSRRG